MAESELERGRGGYLEPEVLPDPDTGLLPPRTVLQQHLIDERRERQTCSPSRPGPWLLSLTLATNPRVIRMLLSWPVIGGLRHPCGLSPLLSVAVPPRPPLTCQSGPTALASLAAAVSVKAAPHPFSW